MGSYPNSVANFYTFAFAIDVPKNVDEDDWTAGVTSYNDPDSLMFISTTDVFEASKGSLEPLNPPDTVDYAPGNHFLVLDEVTTFVGIDVAVFID